MGKWVALVAGNTVAGDLVSVNYEYRDALRPKVSSLLPRVRGRAETSRQAAVLWFFGFGFCCLLLPSQGWPCSAMGVCLLLRKHSWWVRVLQCCGNSWWAWPEFFRTRRWRQHPRVAQFAGLPVSPFPFKCALSLRSWHLLKTSFSHPFSRVIPS